MKELPSWSITKVVGNPHPPIIFILVAAREKLKYSLRKNALSCPGRRQALEHI
jgi:hypothetical protein